jgi:uncharacterized protein (TIGR02328 family)
MRIWHEKLISKLCRQHLLAVWREGLGCYSIIINNKKGYRNHPATQEFIKAPDMLWVRLRRIREEMLRRGYHPKEVPEPTYKLPEELPVKPWQTLEEQTAVLKAKGCKCKI